MKTYFQKQFINILTKYLFNSITVDDILHEDAKGNLYFQGKKLDEDLSKGLRENAKHLVESKLWKVLNFETKYQANKKFMESKDTEDLIFAKAMLFNLKVMNDRLQRLSGKS